MRPRPPLHLAEKGPLPAALLNQNDRRGALTTLTATSEPPGGEFFLAADDERFTLYVPAGLARLPEELHLNVRRFPRRVEAYWNG